MTQDKSGTAKIKPVQTGRERKGPKAPKKITESYLHNAGLYYLQRFAASRSHFRSVMLRKVRKSCLHHKDQDFEACAAMVEALVEKFTRAGLLNDELYLRGMVRSYRRRGLSGKAIAVKLAAKGLAAAQVHEALAACDNERNRPDVDGELAAALIFIRRKKLGAFAVRNTPPDKSLAALARAGFSYDIAKKALEMKREEIESPDGS